MKLLAAALLATALPLAIASADRRPPRQPPRAAFDACAKAKRGDACTVALGDRSIDGTCEQLPDTAALACRPLHPPDPPGPPPEAVAACRSAKEGDACSFTLGDRSLSGACVRGPDAAMPLACRPAGAPPVSHSVSHSACAPPLTLAAIHAGL